MNLRDTPRRRREHPDMEITPLIDVIFLLLIFFLVTTTFSQAAGGDETESNIEIQLPEAASGAQSSPSDRVIVFVTGEGSVEIESDLPLEGDDISSQLSQLHRERPKAAILLKGDEEASHGEMIDVLDRIRQAGFRNVNLVARQRTEPSE